MILFKHNREQEWTKFGLGIQDSAKGGSTLAVQEIEPWFFAALKAGDFFEKKIGLAKCHPKDQFNKKIGRVEASQKMKTKQFKVVKIVDTVEKREVTFDVQDFGELVLVKYTKAQKVRLT